jgi:hypothetical protein
VAERWIFSCLSPPEVTHGRQLVSQAIGCLLLLVTQGLLLSSIPVFLPLVFVDLFDGCSMRDLLLLLNPIKIFPPTDGSLMCSGVCKTVAKLLDGLKSFASSFYPRFPSVYLDFTLYWDRSLLAQSCVLLLRFALIEMENLIQLADSMRQASALLSDEDPEDSTKKSGFLSVVVLGNTVCF